MRGTPLTTLYRAQMVMPDSRSEPIVDGGVLVRGTHISAVGRFEDLRRDASDVSVTELAGTVIPGMVDAHTHLRGVPLELHQVDPAPLEAWICSLGATTALDPGDEAIVACADLIGTGVTSVQGIVSTTGTPEVTSQLLRHTRNGVRASGIRALVILGFTDSAELAPTPRTERFDRVPIETHGSTPADWAQLWSDLKEDSDEELVRSGVGPVAAQWCSDAALSQIAEMRGTARVHVHLNESAAQRNWRGDAEPSVARLLSHQLLGSFCSAAHCVHLLDDELQILRSHGVSLVHCPQSNKRLSVGSAPVRRWIDAGMNVALGLDSQSSTPDMFELMRATLSTAQELEAPLEPREVFDLATVNGAHALGLRAGRLAPGFLADFSTVNLNLIGEENTIQTLIDTASAESVSNVIIDGQQMLTERIYSRRPATDEALSRLLRQLRADFDGRTQRRDPLAPGIRQLLQLQAGGDAT